MKDYQAINQKEQMILIIKIKLKLNLFCKKMRYYKNQ